jgi:tRNA threonylcarbamoyladenosine biosynthesis protein TsaB
VKILALDTATLTASVALLVDDQVAAARQARVSTHSETLLELIAAVLKDAQLEAAEVDLCACGRGPGSFTGLRIGLATAKGLCFALDKPLVVVSSLAALAMGQAPTAGPDTHVLSLLDARKHEVYAGLYRLTPWPLPVREEVVLAPHHLAAYLGDVTGEVSIVGDGTTAYPLHARALGRVLEGVPPTPQAENVARLGLRSWQTSPRDELAHATPTYIRPSEAELKFKAD